MSDHDPYGYQGGPSAPPPSFEPGPPPYQPSPNPPGIGAKIVVIFAALVLAGGVSNVMGCGDSGTEGLEQAEQRLDHSGSPTYQETKEYLCETADFRDDPSC